MKVTLLRVEDWKVTVAASSVKSAGTMMVAFPRVMVSPAATVTSSSSGADGVELPVQPEVKKVLVPLVPVLLAASFDLT